MLKQPRQTAGGGVGHGGPLARGGGLLTTRSGGRVEEEAPAPVKPSDDVGPSQHLTRTHRKTFESESPHQAVPEFLTNGTFKILNNHCSFKM